MNIQWTVVDEFGETKIENHPFINTENAHSYAKNTCQTCWSKGYNHYDDGWQYRTGQDDNGNYHVIREYVNPRYVLCDCSIRTIQRTGL